MSRLRSEPRSSIQVLDSHRGACHYSSARIGDVAGDGFPMSQGQPRRRHQRKEHRLTPLMIFVVQQHNASEVFNQRQGKGRQGSSPGKPAGMVKLSDPIMQVALRSITRVWKMSPR